MSLKRRIKDLREFDFDQAIEILTLRNQGWTFHDIGMSLGISRQRVQQTYKYVSGMTVEEAELYRHVLSNLPIDKTIN